MEFINALIDLYRSALANQDFVNNLASFWGTISGLMAFKRKADWQERFSWLITGYFFSRYGGQLLVSWWSMLNKIEEPLRFFMAMFFSFILALLVKVFEYVGGDPKFIPAIVMALLPSFIANKLQPKDEKNESTT